MGHPWDFPTPSARWPEKVVGLCHELSSATTEPERRRIVSEIWLLVNAALCKYVRFNSRAYALDPEDVRDIASEKSLAFIHQLLDPARGFDASEPARVCAYFSTLARNGLVDHIRRLERQRNAGDGAGHIHVVPDPEMTISTDEFTEALKQAILGLSSKPRTIWFFRVMLEMSSNEIGRHPVVQMRATAVDMALSRARLSIRRAMKKRGFSPHEIPPGTLATLWDTLNEGGIERKADHESG
jgi:DNA-directed RNA polymerase specialized sigma24 family protein